MVSATKNNSKTMLRLSVQVLSFSSIATSFQVSIPSTKAFSQPLKAVIYGLPDGEQDDTMMMSNLVDNDGRKVPSSLFSPEYTAPLARLASARSSGLKLEDIHQVSVNRVDAAKMDIEAIVCERDDCVSLSVPVELPRPCVDEHTEESFERCIVENLAVLDQSNAGSASMFATEEEIELARRVNEELTSLDGIEYPQWWQSGDDATAELQRECATLCNILNEAEFQADLKSLVSTRDVFQESDIAPGSVFVLQIGLSGIIVRASAFQSSKLMGITEIPIAFPAPASTTDNLREFVLSTVEQRTS